MDMNMRITSMSMAVMALASCTTSLTGVGESEDSGEIAVSTCDWPQQFGNSAHAGKACAAPHGLQVVARVETDADALAENDFAGFLQIHEGSAVASGDFVVVPHSAGFDPEVLDDTGVSTKTYDVRVMRWLPSVSALHRTLAPAWAATTDWQPIDVAVASFGFITNGYVQVFQPVIAGGSVYIPGRSGTVVRRSLATGALEATIDPFAGTPLSGDPRVVQAGALAVSPNGRIFYTVTAHSTSASPFGRDPRNSWLVEVGPTNVVRLQAWSAIAVPSLGIPQTTDLCARPFFLFGRSPTGPNDHSNMAQCGVQRPATNVPVAFDGAGNIIVESYATRELSANFLVRLSAATLAPIAAYDTRGHLFNGCGVRIPLSDPDCQILTAGGTTQIGVDPDYNTPVRFQGGDLMDSAPLATPTGDLVIGGYTGGLNGDGLFDARGAGMAFTPSGVRTNEVFFWEVTPAVVATVGGTTYAADLNEYSDGRFAVSRWSSSFDVLSRGEIPTSSDAAFSDWLDTQPATNTDGTACGVNAQGFFGCFDAAGVLVEGAELVGADGAPVSMETLSNHIARDIAGDYLVNYAGYLWVIAGGGPSVRRPAMTVGVAAKLGLSRAAKQASLARAPIPAIRSM